MTWTVADVMTRDVVTVGPASSFKACAELMRAHGVSALPVVVAGGRLAGLVSEADLMGNVARIPDEPALPARADKQSLTAADVMTADVVTIASTASVAAAARLMFERHVKRLPVVDSSHHVIGIVSRSDVLRVFLRGDDAIRKEVSHGLLNELPLLGRGRVQVDVKDGVVTLSGQVESGSLTGLLLRLVAAVPGVVGVENRLEFTPDLKEVELAGQRAATGRG